MADDTSTLLDATASVVAAFAANHEIPPAELPALIGAVHRALAGLSAPEAAAAETIKLTPAQIRKSVTPDALISFEDGKGYKTLKRHLATRGLTLAAYKAKWGLPSDYPTTAPNYSATRSALAKSLGLGAGGRKGGKTASAAAAPARRGRPPKPAK